MWRHTRTPVNTRGAPENIQICPYRFSLFHERRAAGLLGREAVKEEAAVCFCSLVIHHQHSTSSGSVTPQIASKGAQFIRSTHNIQIGSSLISNKSHLISNMKLSTFSMHLPALVAASLAPSVMSQRGEVYLTFDDGPIGATFGVLDVLAEMDIKATFFLNAFHCFGEGDENEDNAVCALKRTVEDGHVIANHSYNHMLHNCCNDDGECGAEVCNQISMWNVGAYQDVERETELFHLNTKVLRQLIKSHSKGEVLSNDKLHSMGRLPYMNSYRLDDTNSDCACCTTDDVPVRNIYSLRSVHAISFPFSS